MIAKIRDVHVSKVTITKLQKFSNRTPDQTAAVRLNVMYRLHLFPSSLFRKNMKELSVIQEFSSAFDAEVPATRKCIERVPESTYEWRPHEKSMTMGYLTTLVAEIPKWIAVMIETHEIDFKTFDHFLPKTTAEMVKHFDDNVAWAQKAFRSLSEEAMFKNFVLRDGDRIMMDSPLKGNIISTMSHWVHHRGQLTVYMRLNDILVPSIYGPSADEKMP